MSESSPYQVPRAPGRWRAIALALIVHLALLAFLWIGVSWQNKPPLTVEAEIWDPQIKEAAPLPQPEPEPSQPTPEPQAAPPKIEEPVLVKPDIALEKEQEKKRKAQEQQRKIAADKLIKADRLKKEKQEDEKKLAKQKEEADAKKKADAEKIDTEKKQKQAVAENKAAEQRRQEETKRLLSQATSSSGGTGDAAKSQGPRGSSDYGAKIGLLIRSNTRFDVPPGMAGNPPVEYAVELFPDGSIRSIVLIKASGVPGFDEEVKRGITKSQPFPADKDGKVPSGFPVRYQPKDIDK